MGTLVGCPGVKAKEIDVVFFRSVSGGMKAFQNNRAITTAGDNGAINVYVDDDGNYRCFRFRHYVTMAERITRFKSEVRDWLKSELPKIN